MVWYFLLFARRGDVPKACTPATSVTRGQAPDGAWKRQALEGAGETRALGAVTASGPGWRAVSAGKKRRLYGQLIGSHKRVYPPESLGTV